MFLAGHPSQGCFGLQSHCAPCYFFNQASFYPSDFSFRSPSRNTIDGCGCNGLMSTEPGKLIVTKLSFQMNHASICGTIMAAFVLDARVGLVGQRLSRDPRPVASKDELMLRKEAIWNSLPQGDIQNLFDSMPRRIAALIAARGGYTKY
ncbi:transposable element Tcb2 transposase [Trichonephila clavipes]|nr:transposable element Tcb2 transposase [Trichonephila clavipes]